MTAAKGDGCKRHLLVDTDGLLVGIIVHLADIQDRDGGQLVLADPLDTCPRLRHLWVDAGYRGRFVDWVRTTRDWSVEVVQHWWIGVRFGPSGWPRGFQVLPRRWVVERTFAWLGWYRRLSKDCKVLPATEEAWIYLAMSRLLTVRLAR